MTIETLEAKYRRLSRLFPPGWRAEHEDALVGTLLDAAEPGRDSVPLAEALDLVQSALVVRTRTLLARLRAAAPARRVAAATIALLAAVGTGLVARFAVDEVSAEFLLTSLVVVLIPGTGVLYTISSAISGGWRRGTFAAVGCTLGIVPHILAALVGLSGVLQAGAAAFEVVRWAGVAYLVFMGISMIRERGELSPGADDTSATDTTAGDGSMARVVRRAVLLNLLNPKLTVFFFAFLPQFLDEPPGVGDLRLVGLSAVFMLETLAVFLLYAGLSAALRERVLRTPAILRWVRRSLGSLLLGFAAHLALTDR
jgi:threonine/homoserine/homoserine lactone efflux protein